jgi:NADPH2:quinone reductase
MRAVLCRAFGPPESLVVADLDEPRAGPGEVVIDVQACPVNFPDLLMIQNLYQFKPALPFSPGSEVAGVVSEVGEAVANVAVGDRVFASTGWGGLAEKVAVKAVSVVPIPDGIDAVSASGFLYAYGTSYHALKDRARLQPGETVLVLGAAGGVGLAAVELGAVMGGKVIAAASSDDKLDICRQHGAVVTLNYENQDLRTRVKELTDGRGVDVVYDPVGGRYSEPALRSIAWDGRFLVVGFAAGEIPRLPLNLPLLKACSVVGVFFGAYAAREPGRAQENLNELVALWKAGKLRPHVSSTYPLERAAEAIREIADRRAEGKVVVVMDGSSPPSAG